MIVNATYVSVWDGETEIRTECKWDTTKRIALEIATVEAYRVDVFIREYVELLDGTHIAVDSHYETDDGIPSLDQIEAAIRQSV